MALNIILGCIGLLIFLIGGLITLGLISKWIEDTKIVLQERFSAVESTLNKEIINLKEQLEQVAILAKQKVSQEFMDYQLEVQKQYAELFKKHQDNFKSEVAATKAEAATTIKTSKSEFEKLLQTKFDEAADLVKFKEIEYNDTIKRKRRKQVAKRPPTKKPNARKWRSITDE